MAKGKGISKDDTVLYNGDPYYVIKTTALEVHLDDGTIVDLTKENVTLIEREEKDNAPS